MWNKKALSSSFWKQHQRETLVFLEKHLSIFPHFFSLSNPFIILKLFFPLYVSLSMKNYEKKEEEEAEDDDVEKKVEVMNESF